MDETLFPTLGLSHLDPYEMTATERELARQVAVRDCAKRLVELGGTRRQLELATEALRVAERHVASTRSRLTSERKASGLH